MKTLIVTCALLACALGAAAAQDVIVVRATKKAITGTISNITEKACTIVTPMGMLTYPWEALDEKTIKRYNPDLYAQMLEAKQKAFEEMKKKQGLVKYKGKWMLPKQKDEAEKKDQGLALFEGKWMPTNKVEELELKKRMEASGRKEYKGKWYTEDELREVKSQDANKGLKVGMSSSEVTTLWGKPAQVKVSQEFQARKRECWFYPNKEEGTEDRVVFEMGAVKEVSVSQEISGSADE